MKVGDIRLKIIPDSRGQDTLEAEMISGEVSVTASVPSGKSTGKNEAALISPQNALEKVSWIKSQIGDTEFATLDQFDHLLTTLDGTPNKQKLGGNLILVLSIAFTKLLAKKGNLETFELIGKIAGTRERKLPYCFYNLIEGGVHVEQVPNKDEPPPPHLPFQEYLLIPQTNSPRESLNEVLLFIKLLGEKIHQRFEKLKQGDEGGYTIPSADPAVGLEVLNEVREEGGWEESKLGLDVAASTFRKDNLYLVGEKTMTTDQLLDFYSNLASGFRLLSIEDPFAEDDWQGFFNLQSRIGSSVWIVGDDLTTTNIAQIRKAKEKEVVNAVIIKPTQIGTVTETIQAANLAKSYGWKVIVSHRSGETKDTFIADLAVGLGADGFKSGCPLQEERLVKYQRLVEIEKLCRT